MKIKKIFVTFVIVYTVMFLIGPWHFYGELKNDAEKGIRQKDHIDSAVAAAWDGEKLKVCLKGRVDGEAGEIYVELDSTNIKQESIGKFEAEGEFRHIIPLARSQYRNKCEPLSNGNYQTNKAYFKLSSKSYSIKTIKEQTSSSADGNYILLKLSRDQGVNRYKNHFAVYVKNTVDSKLAWFALKGVYTKRVNPSPFDYFIALVKDYFTMPYQWLAMIVYASGGIG